MLVIYEDISFTDTARGAITVINNVVLSSITLSPYDDIIWSPTEEQKQGAVLTTSIHCRQDIQAARVLIVLFILKIELGYDQIRIRYRYPLEADPGKRYEEESLEAESIERSLHEVDRKSIQSIYELAPHLAVKPLLP
jgi:hypothetical protein